MNQENFEQAYVESNARIALVLAESLGLISELKSAGQHSEVIGRSGGNPRTALVRRHERIEAAESGQSEKATRAGIEAFKQARGEGEPADRSRERQIRAAEEQRKRDRGR